MINELIKVVLILFGLGLSTFLIRKWINDLSAKVENMAALQHACRESLPKEYASAEDFKVLQKRVNIHGEKINYFQGKLNGVA